MTKTQSEFRLFYEIGFDFSHCLSIDDAVLVMLGISNRPLFEITEAMSESLHDAYLHGYDEPDFEPMLWEVLRDVKEVADSDYSNARLDNVSQEELEQRLEDIKKAHELIKTAYLFKCHIHDELAKGDLSELRLDVSSSSDNPHITLKSLSDWSSKHYKIELLAGGKPITFRDLNLDIDRISHDIRNGLNVQEVEKLRISFALLVGAFADSDVTFRQNNKPNVKKIAEHIEKISSKCSGGLKRSDSTVKNEINKSLLTKEGKPGSESLSKTKATTLYILLAFIYEELVKARFPDNPAFEEHITEIAAELATNNTCLEGQELDSIIARIQKALDVKNNPDKRED